MSDLIKNTKGPKQAAIDVVELVREIESRPPEQLPGDLAAMEIFLARAEDIIDELRAKLAAVESLIDVDADFDEQFDDKTQSWRDGYMCAMARVDVELDTGRQKSTVLAGWKRR